MRRTTIRSVARAGIALGCIALLGATPARSGQVRVDVGVGGQLTFTPYAVNINAGDHVVWVWKTGGHTVTNWKLPADSLAGTFDGTIFDSAPGSHLGQPNTTRFSWKSPDTLDVPYFCVPHGTDMTGRVIISNGPTVPVADFRITEVQFNDPGGHDLIEIANLGTATGNLGHYRIDFIGSGTGTDITGTASTGNDFLVPAGDRVIVHLNATGTNTAPTHLYLPGISLPDAAGGLALYVASGLAPQNAVTNKDLMIDFVQWGAPGQANETTAAQAGLWAAGTSLNGVAAGHSIEYCASATLERGANHWAEVATPNFGSNDNCATPVASETWGRLKTIYRR